MTHQSYFNRKNYFEVRLSGNFVGSLYFLSILNQKQASRNIADETKICFAQKLLIFKKFILLNQQYFLSIFVSTIK